MTSKRQVTVPKAVAERYGIEPGVELEWQPAGEVIRVIPPGRKLRVTTVEARLALFDAATERQRVRQNAQPQRAKAADRPGRGWTRDELYDRRPPGRA